MQRKKLIPLPIQDVIAGRVARSNQRYRASGLNLVVAAIVLWNTVYLERATWPEAPTPAPAPSPVAADTKKAKKGIK